MTSSPQCSVLEFQKPDLAEVLALSSLVLLAEGVPARIEDVWKMSVSLEGDVRGLLLSLQVCVSFGKIWFGLVWFRWC